MENPRRQALYILDVFEETDAYSNIILNKLNNNLEISYQDKKFITNLVYGVVENKFFLDYIIRNYSSIRLKKIHSSILNILRLGAYQIIFLDKVPDFAAIDESVKMARKINYKSKGFVNAILRKISNNKEKLPLPEDEIEKISIKYSYDKWIIKRWIEDFGIDFTKEMVDFNSLKPELTVRVNTLKCTKKDLINSLAKKGFLVEESEIISEALIIKKSPISLFSTVEFKEGKIFIQDLGSMLISKILNPNEKDIVLDVCAAPGGKTTFMAQIMNNKGKIIARDVYTHKIDLIEQNLDRLGIKNVITEIVDGTLENKSDYERFDKILLDAPCSGLGIIRRKPEIKFTKSEKDIEELSDLQYKLLEVNSKYLKKGGRLVYSTCSIDKRENEEIIEKFIKLNKNFKISSIELFGNSEKWLKLFPNLHKTDGFFICLLEKL